MKRGMALFAAVSLSYYAGGLLGLQLRIPPAAPAVLWPPNAILTVALLSTPPRLWTVCLTAALAGHLAVQLPADWPAPLVLAWYLTNCTEALIAAGTLCVLSDTPARIDTLRRFWLFLLIVVAAAPLIATFADAAAVALLRGDPYWSVWQDRLVGSILGELVIVPAGIGLIAALRHPPKIAARRGAEAAALGAALLISAWPPPQAFPGRSIVSVLWIERPMLVHVPLVLWVAARFGLTATSIALLWTTIATAWSAVHGYTPFNALPDPRSTIVALQLLLIVMAITLLSFAVVIEERTWTERTLAERLDFEALLSRLSAAFVHLPSDRMQPAFGDWLSRLGTSFGVDAVHLFDGPEDLGNLRVIAGWTKDGRHLLPLDDYRRQLPWTFNQLKHGNIVSIETLHTLPAEAEADRECLRQRGITSGLVIPLFAGGAVTGAMCFGTSHERTWPDGIIGNLQLVAEVFANALARKRNEDALRVSEAMKSSILESLTSGVAVIDAHGEVRAVNENWTRMMMESDGAGYPPVLAGDNLLLRLQDAGERQADARAVQVLAAIRAVLAGARDRALFEHAAHEERGTRWFVMLVTRLKGPENGAVLTYTDISERRRAEFEVQRSRQELAHVARFATMGEMAMSLAHQLNQPLAAIMTNANAATKLLEATPIDRAELCAILTDIVADDRRAAEVIRRFRDLLRKDGPPRGTIDLGKAIQDAVKLVHSDALIRNIDLTVETPALLVRGDRVQLQQAVLNLIVNALEAVGESGTTDARWVSVTCERIAGDLARICIRDTGPGVAAGEAEVMFEPFYTTKAHGMGMGLSIVRSIVEAHNGAVRVVPHDGPGAWIELTIPLDEPAMA